MPDPEAVLPNGSLQAHVLSYSAQDHLPRDSTSHNGLNPLTFISYQENATQTCPQGIIPQRRSPIKFTTEIPFGTATSLLTLFLPLPTSGMLLQHLP